MKSSSLVYVPIMALCMLFSIAEAQQTFHTTPTTVIGYLEYLPQGYASNSDQYPVVIFLHGSGERGSTSIDPVEIQKTISLVAKNGPPKHVNAGTQFPFILISPQLKSNLGNWSSSYINEVINYCKTYLRIDERRIYLTGLSLGGGGTWWDAQDFPKTFAAIAPVCGSRNTLTAACNIAAENLPVWAFHGDADTTVPVNRTIKMVNAINACTPTPTPLAKVTVYPGVNHNAWDNAYRPDHSLHNPNVYEWMLSFTNTVNGGNIIPLVNAGQDITVNMASPSVTLIGSASDSDGNVANYEWSQLSGPSAVTFSNKTLNAPILSNLTEGIYVFKLKVTDNGGDINSDYVMLTVLPKPTNLPPIAVAGKDSTIILPTNTITLVGAGNDSDGTITSYQWSKVSGAAATLTGASTNALCASSLNTGAYVFRLTVTDNLGAAQTDDVAVTVLSNNILPTVNAGVDKTIKLPNTSTALAGVASDADGSIASYSWTKVSGGVCTFSSTTIARPSISNLASGTYVLRLTVTDNNGGVSSDDVTYVASYPPTADAGADIVITLPTSSVTLPGTASDSDGTITQYLWGKYTGPAALVTSKNTATTQAVNLLEGTYVFRFTVTDDAGLQTIDYVSVTVLPEVAHTSTTARVASANDIEEAPIANTTEQSASVFDLTSESTENNFLVVYNDAGVVLFSGTWKASLYDNVFNHEGLYICNMVKDNKKSSHKLFISRN